MQLTVLKWSGPSFDFVARQRLYAQLQGVGLPPHAAIDVGQEVHSLQRIQVVGTAVFRVERTCCLRLLCGSPQFTQIVEGRGERQPQSSFDQRPVREIAFDERCCRFDRTPERDVRPRPPPPGGRAAAKIFSSTKSSTALVSPSRSCASCFACPLVRVLYPHQTQRGTDDSGSQRQRESAAVSTGLYSSANCVQAVDR